MSFISQVACEPATPTQAYVGRFAPSPTGALHAGSLASALASYLDARAHQGRWLLRIEDLDPPREVAGAARLIIDTLSAFGFEADGPVVFQSERGDHCLAAFERLAAMGALYPCACTRREIADSVLSAGTGRARHHELVYPGTCRLGMPPGRSPRAWRVRVDDRPIAWRDRSVSTTMNENLADRVGDFVLRRADGLWAYQLAVVVDDHLQGVNQVVRGRDLIDFTARQIHLQRLLGLSTPTYLHLPVVTNAQGEKLSKQTGARPLSLDDPVAQLDEALVHLGLGRTGARSVPHFWPLALACWRASDWMQQVAG